MRSRSGSSLAVVQCLGGCHGKTVSTIRMRFAAWAGMLWRSRLFVVAALMTSRGMSGTTSKARIRATVLALVG